MNMWEFMVASAASSMVTLTAAIYNLPPWIVITSYPVCFLLGYVVGQRHRCHGP